MTDLVVSELIKKFGLNVERKLPMQAGYRNKNYPLELVGGQIVNLIVYKREPGMAETIRSVNRLGAYLHANRFPARHSVDNRIVRVFAAPNEQYAALYAYLPGKTIPWEAYTMAHIKMLGKTMSDMHALLANQAQTKLPTIAAVYLPIIDRMQQYFCEKQTATAMNKKLALWVDAKVFTDAKTLISISKHLPGSQPLHMDFVRSNILFADNSQEITGVLDFEKAAYAPPVFDIARTLAFLLVDCKYKTDAQVRKYFLQSGYIKYGRAEYNPKTVATNGQIINVLEEAINMFLFYDFYKFLRHNPYESLDQNEHFVRTVKLLVSRGVIRSL